MSGQTHTGSPSYPADGYEVRDKSRKIKKRIKEKRKKGPMTKRACNPPQGTDIKADPHSYRSGSYRNFRLGFRLGYGENWGVGLRSGLIRGELIFGKKVADSVGIDLLWCL